MTLEELKAEARRQGYRLQKITDYDCSCYMPYPNERDRHASEAKMGRTTIVVIHPRVVDINGYAQYLGMCKQAAREFGREAGAIVGVRRCRRNQARRKLRCFFTMTM